MKNLNHQEQTGGGLPRQEETGAVALEEKSEARPETAQEAQSAPAAEDIPKEPAPEEGGMGPAVPEDAPEEEGE